MAVAVPAVSLLLLVLFGKRLGLSVLLVLRVHGALPGGVCLVISSW